MKKSRLYVDNIKKSYKDRAILQGISLEVNEGEIIGLLGPNGAGKTTTFKCLLGFIKPDEGNIYLDKEDITNLPVYERAKKGISFLPQESSIFKDLTVLENLVMFLEFQYDDKKIIYEKAEELLEEFGIERLKNQKASTLSGGERRRLEIARSLIINPSFLLLDEPFAGVDPVSVKDINNLIKSLIQKDIGIILTDHNVRETLKITDRAYIIAHGKVIAEGKPEKIVNDEYVKKVFLGEDFILV
ncbi:LPS export ABC transporter ATP-binding protein [Hydrogenothermus marinus]|uniref:Lipopolysaccharide export system ATP-binding protein LptB n=1 Tax=Hydrogenothermus marinus TaxID=133270 RepID=A0A3M0B7E5_9AQUI|nr:LPS export ABC transporter ATP-binding protein [Hydrogenothermus marinus]RMA93340.1 lipopolysaccharide export system ATP-binding protein [Hydrogenothermus marinus]